MSEQEIIENNTLLAEYEGLKFFAYCGNKSFLKEFDTYSDCSDFIKKNNHVGYIPELWWGAKSGRYDHDYNSLMRVVEKVVKTKYDDGDHAYFRTFGQLNKDGLYMARINRHGLFQAETLQEVIYLAVLDFVKSEKKQPIIEEALSLDSLWDKTNYIVRHNLMTRPGYAPYCGSNVPRPPVVNGCTNPRTVFNGDQFVCPDCGFTTEFPDEFILLYKINWGLFDHVIEYKVKKQDGE